MIPKEILKAVITKQRSTMERMDQGVPREKGDRLKIDDSFATIITGIRRCGKSTFLHQLLKKQKKSYYLNLEDPRLDGLDLTDFNKVEDIMQDTYGKGGTYFFDEIQNVEGWEKFIRYLVDKKEKVVITGSNASLLSRELGTRLTGRHLQAEMFPFSYKEFLSLRKEKPGPESFKGYLSKGGFPEYLKKEEPPIHHELLSDIVMRDIATRFGIKNTDTLKKIAIYLISNAGKEFSYNSIKSMLRIKSVQSVIDYISYFEDAYLIFTIPRFSNSYKKQQINPKKVYSIDTGFSNSNSATFSQDKGRVLENAVFLGLRRLSKEIFYYKEEKECDFLVKKDGKIVEALQSCFDMTEENKEREIEGLLSAMKKFRLKEGTILTYNQEDRFTAEGKNIYVKPVWKWLTESKQNIK